MSITATNSSGVSMINAEELIFLVDSQVGVNDWQEDQLWKFMNFSAQNFWKQQKQPLC